MGERVQHDLLHRPILWRLPLQQRRGPYRPTAGASDRHGHLVWRHPGRGLLHSSCRLSRQQMDCRRRSWLLLDHRPAVLLRGTIVPAVLVMSSYYYHLHLVYDYIIVHG